jgi:hypothetical protein
LTAGDVADLVVPKRLDPADGADAVGKPNLGAAGVVVGVVDEANIDFGFSVAGVAESKMDLGFSTAGVVVSKNDLGFSTAGVVASISASLASPADKALAESLRERPKPPPKSEPPPPFCPVSLSFAVLGSALKVVPSTNGEPKAELP